MKNYFQGNSKHPQHISVGAILLNDKNEVCAHLLYAKDLKGYWKEEGVDDFYILRRETISPNETLEGALHRGLLEEFGAEAEILDYIGSIQTTFPHKGIDVQKTTLYFLCRLKSQDLTKRSDSTDDVEARSKVEWRAADYLIPKMREQSKKYKRGDVDESSILERVKNYLKQ